MRVEAVHLNRYAGLRHECARIPNRFQRQCALDKLAVHSLRTESSVSNRPAGWASLYILSPAPD